MNLKTVDRTVSKLRQEGLLTVQRGKICISSDQRERMAERLDWEEAGEPE